MKQICSNRQANYLYTIEDTLEVGIELYGTEVKSLRAGKVNLKDSFAIIKNKEVLIRNMHISPYEFGNIHNKSPVRDRKLLLNRNEILKLNNVVKQKGYTLVPLSLYFKDRWVKLSLGVCKGKNIYDKRQSIKERDMQREIKEI